MKKNICVFCSSSDAVDEIYFKATEKLGKLIVENGFSLLYGGAKIGLMGAAAKSVKKHGGYITGVIPQVLFQKGLYYKQCDELIQTNDMAERKLVMENKAHAFISLPGGFGTLEEILQVITLKQLQYFDKPVVFLNINSFYDDLINVFEKLYKENFAKQDYRGLYFITDKPESAIEYIIDYKPGQNIQKWF